ncbi:MAG: extracellular solute-binding protein [Bacteroidales bacterium]|nr:extracellular solute-binding protein [Bacteroidales bacterium]
MKRITVYALAITFIGGIIFGCGGSNKSKEKQGELKGEISISGAFALYPLVVKWADEFKQANPGVRIDISAGGAGKGMTDVLANMVDLGMVSREIHEAEIEKGALGIGVAIDAVVPTLNVNNPLINELLQKGLTREMAKELWMKEKNWTWEEFLGRQGETSARIYTRSDACGAAETYAAWMGGKQEDLTGTAVFGDPGLAMAIQKDKWGAGYNNLGYAYDEKTRKPNQDLVIFPIDVNGNGKIDTEESFYETKDDVIKAIAEGKYPSPPARELYLVSKGIPQKPEVLAFLEYILTKGQELNIPLGYINIAQDKLNTSLSKLGIKQQDN